MRRFFNERDYLEVDTPILAPALIPEPHIEVFETEFRHPHAQDGTTLAGWVPGGKRYLVPSPEIWMKELLACGFPDMFQISHCFRNAENVGPMHCPEFTMLEWYTVGADYRQSINLTDSLLAELGSLEDAGFSNQGLAMCRRPVLQITMGEAFEEFTGIPARAIHDPEALADAAARAGLSPGDAGHASGRTGGSDPAEAEDLFQRLFLTHVERKLPREQPVVLTDYPSYLPTLATPGESGAERWELYLAGVELANCYGEDRNPLRLKSYVDSAAVRKRESLVPHAPVEGLQQFSNAPPCSGVALGMDRLLMVLTGLTDIQDVIFSSGFGIFRRPSEGRGSS